MGNCCTNGQQNEEENITYITYSDLLQDFDDQNKDKLDNSFSDNEESKHDKKLSFKVRLSKFKGRLF